MPAQRKAKRPDGSPQAWQRRAAERPAEILRAARALLEEHGYAAVSMARIARQAGVSEATLYKYFEHKQDLMGQVLREWATPFIEGLQQELPLVTGLRARITLIATRYLRGMSLTPRLHRVYYQELRWDEAYIGSPMHKLNQRFAGIAVKVIEEAIANGEVAPDTNPVVVRDLLFGGLEHIGQRTTFAGRPLDVDAEAQAFARHLLDGIALKRGVEAAPAAVPDVQALNALVGRLQQAVDDLENLRNAE